ncbi:hypothetical protein D927_02526 [Enterococcus faecalis 02-MB-BW-10]|nr:hypothetical protein D927_02526 [Enterococcus faecalis 02-MB-BW-10]
MITIGEQFIIINIVIAVVKAHIGVRTESIKRKQLLIITATGSDRKKSALRIQDFLSCSVSVYITFWWRLIK